MADFSFVARLPETLSTERLFLRVPGPEDVEAMARLANNRNVHKWVSRMPYPYGESDAIEFIEGKARSATNHAFSVVTQQLTFIGVMGFHIEEADQTVEFGYWFGQPYWGEGYASEAARGLMDSADAARSGKVFARVQTANAPSMRVLEKCGFVKFVEKIADCGPHKGVAISYFEREPQR